MTPDSSIKPHHSHLPSSTFQSSVYVSTNPFSIDGVLLRSAKPIPGAREALEYLQRYRIPFILLTNGGGKHERTRVADISKSLRLQLHESNFIQSHTPFAELVHGSDDQAALQDKCILVMGGEGDRCREVAESYVPLFLFSLY